jgi:hypothetical protein
VVKGDHLHGDTLAEEEGGKFCHSAAKTAASP